MVLRDTTEDTTPSTNFQNSIAKRMLFELSTVSLFGILLDPPNFSLLSSRVGGWNFDGGGRDV